MCVCGVVEHCLSAQIPPMVWHANEELIAKFNQPSVKYISILKYQTAAEQQAFKITFYISVLQSYI